MKHVFIYCIVLIMWSGCSRTPSPGASLRTIAFVNKSDTTNHIWLLDIDDAGVGHNARRLTNDNEAENYPSWSPDGKHLVYQRSYNGSAIYRVDANGQNERRLSPSPGYDATPSWSPDGTRIIYTRVDSLITPNQVPQTDIHIMNEDGSGDRAILTNSEFSVEPRWSVNNQIVFMSLLNGSQQIFTMDTSGAQISQLTQAGNNGDPAWSPDGTQISFGSNRQGNGLLNIFVMHSDGSNVRQLTHYLVPDESGDTNWSTDGTKIIFEYDVDGQFQSNPTAFAEVWTMNADGSDEVNTQQPCSCVGCAPRWQPQ